MRTQTAILLVFCLAGVAFAETSKFKLQLTNLMNMQSKAVDAVDSALNLLRDLKQANLDAQARSDEINRTHEEQLGQAIADLTSIADQNKQVGDDATAHRKKIESEIQITQENLAWINNRRNEIIRKRDYFREQRCYASLAFVKQLKEHDEALQVIAWLKTDVLGIVQGTSEVQLEQIHDSAKKLEAYTHLFNEQAMSDFLQLTQGPQNVDASTAEWDERSDDNSRNSLNLNRMGAGTDARDVGNQLLNAINRLYEHLEASMEDLKKNEIRAAWDLVKWLQGTEAELKQLDDDQVTKTNYIDRLLVAVVGAKAREEEAWEIYFESAATLNDAIADREAKRAWYAQEKARRDEENAVLDEVIRIFIERVQGLDAGLKNKVNDFSVDSVFQDSDIRRETDTSYSRDKGRLQQNIENEVGRGF